MKKLAYALLGALYIVHTDIWFWDDPSLVLGLPVGLAFHIGFMFAAAGALWFAVQHAWPAHLEAEIEEDRS